MPKKQIPIDAILDLRRRLDQLRLDCTETGELYAKKLEQSSKALLLKTFSVKLSRNFSIIIGLKYKKFHSDDT